MGPEGLRITVIEVGKDLQGRVQPVSVLPRALSAISSRSLSTSRNGVSGPLFLFPSRFLESQKIVLAACAIAHVPHTVSGPSWPFGLRLNSPWHVGPPVLSRGCGKPPLLSDAVWLPTQSSGAGISGEMGHSSCSESCGGCWPMVRANSPGMGWRSCLNSKFSLVWWVPLWDWLCWDQRPRSPDGCSSCGLGCVFSRHSLFAMRSG